MITVLSARYVNPEGTAAEVFTEERGAVLLSAVDTPGLWSEMLATVAPDPWTEPDLAEQVKAEAARRLNLLAADYTPEERATWEQQVREAEAYEANPSAPTPFLARRAAARGDTVADAAARVLQLGEAFADAAGIILGAQDALLAMDPIPADYRDNSYWAGGE